MHRMDIRMPSMTIGGDQALFPLRVVRRIRINTVDNHQGNRYEKGFFQSFSPAVLQSDTLHHLPIWGHGPPSSIDPPVPDGLTGAEALLDLIPFAFRLNWFGVVPRSRDVRALGKEVDVRSRFRTKARHLRKH